jgi:glycerate dehydrogenase
MMKRSAILLNAGRGGIVNETHLVRALDEDLIAAAGMDVYEKEPIDAKNPLLQVKNKEKLALTPHVTWASLEARTLLMEIVGQNIEEFLREGK